MTQYESKKGTHEASQYMVSLVSCHHMLTFRRAHLPARGDEVWCMRCRAMRRVASVVGMYHAGCNGCRFSRYYGAAKITAQHAADKHARKAPGHTVTVTLGEEVISTHGKDAAQPLLPFDVADWVGVETADGTPLTTRVDLPPF